MTLRNACTLAALVLALGTWVTTPALATDSGAYLGLNIGQSDVDVDDADYEDPSLDSFSLDNSDTAWSLAVGYRFSPYIGVELSYLDMGALTVDFSDRQILGAPNAYFEQSGHYAASAIGPAFALVTAIPTGNFEFNARFALWKAKTEITSSSHATLVLPPFQPQVSNYSDSDSDTTTEFIYGLGMGYTIGDHFHVRIDWVMAPDVGDEDALGEADINLWTAGFQYRF